MSSWNDYIWEFDEGTLNKFEEIQEGGMFEEVAQEILDSTNLRTVFVDELRGTKTEYATEDKFNDDVNIAIQIINDKYDLLKEDGAI